MRKATNDPLKTKLTVGTYFVCLILSFISSITAFAFWLITGLNIALNSSYTESYLESDNFIERHFDEHITVRICRYIQSFLEDKFILMFFIAFAFCILFIVLIWYASKKNSYIFVKFQAAVTTISGILMIALPSLLLILKVPGSVKLINAQNTILFSAYIKSSCFILIAIGILLLAVAFTEEFLAATIIKNRKNTYIRSQKQTHIDM